MKVTRLRHRITLWLLPVVLVLCLLLLALWSKRWGEEERRAERSQEMVGAEQSGLRPPGSLPPLLPPPPPPRHYATYTVRPGPQNIFFVDTSCLYNISTIPQGGSVGGVALQYKHACSVYSVAARHPERPVYLFHTCPLDEDFYEKSSQVVRRVLDLSNVRVVKISADPEDWFKGSPLEGFGKTLEKADFRVVQSSDALRVLLLWKYGGQYFDQDVILLRNITELGEDWVGPEARTTMNQAILNLGVKGPGHDMAVALMEEMHRTSLKEGTAIGPMLFKSVLSKKCNFSVNEDFSKLGRLKCGLTIYPQHLLFPLVPELATQFYQQDSWNFFEPILAKAYTVHFWRTSYGRLKIKRGSPYHKVAQKFCPPIQDSILE